MNHIHVFPYGINWIKVENICTVRINFMHKEESLMVVKSNVPSFIFR
jgi:hypothetical protein